MPSCLWSQRIFPSLPGSRLTIFHRDASSSLLRLANHWLNFTYSRIIITLSATDAGTKILLWQESKSRLPHQQVCRWPTSPLGRRGLLQLKHLWYLYRQFRQGLNPAQTKLYYTTGRCGNLAMKDSLMARKPLFLSLSLQTIYSNILTNGFNISIIYLNWILSVSRMSTLFPKHILTKLLGLNDSKKSYLNVLTFFPLDFYLFPYLIWLIYPFPSFILFRCPCPCFVFLSGLSCTIYICIWLPFLPYAYYMWLPWFVFVSWFFPLLNPSLAKMSSAGYFHARFLLSAFFSFLFRPCSPPICFGVTSSILWPQLDS